MQIGNPLPRVRTGQVCHRRPIAEGRVDAPASSTPEESVILEGREGKFAPLRSLSGKTLLAHASTSVLALAGSTSLPAAVTSKFAPAEFLALNQGEEEAKGADVYHGVQHPINVAETVTTIAKNAGRSEERAQFLGDVALLHDADERILLDGQGGYSFADGPTKARVPVTLAWMDANKPQLQARFEWDSEQFTEAKALIAGSEHPLSDKLDASRDNNLPSFDGRSSRSIYQEQLGQLPKQRQSQVHEDMQLLRAGDQWAENLQAPEAVEKSVIGLAKEVNLPVDKLKQGKPAFIAGVGRDNESIGDLPQTTSRAVAADLGLDGEARVFSQEELHGFLSPGQHQRLEATRAHFGKFSG